MDWDVLPHHQRLRLSHGACPIRTGAVLGHARSRRRPRRQAQHPAPARHQRLCSVRWPFARDGRCRSRDEKCELGRLFTQPRLDKPRHLTASKGLVSDEKNSRHEITPYVETLLAGQPAVYASSARRTRTTDDGEVDAIASQSNSYDLLSGFNHRRHRLRSRRHRLRLRSPPKRPSLPWPPSRRSASLHHSACRSTRLMSVLVPAVVPLVPANKAFKRRHGASPPYGQDATRRTPGCTPVSPRRTRTTGVAHPPSLRVTSPRPP